MGCSINLKSYLHPYCISFEAALTTSHFYPLAHSVPHSVDIHQTHISGAVHLCQGCSPMRKPVLIPRDFTQQTKKQTNKHLIIASHHLLIFHPLKDYRRQQSGQRYCLPPKSCMSAISVHRFICICQFVRMVPHTSKD